MTQEIMVAIAIEAITIFGCWIAWLNRPYIGARVCETSRKPVHPPKTPPTPIIDNGGWIPVCERLPRFDEDVLVYLKNDENETILAVVERQKFILKGKVTIGWFATVNPYGDNALEEKYIVAWRELPKPYKDGAE